ncbi:structural maintenance of chromosomes protein 6-like, partial [Trifolium medium]|nr:structural maintenance of chromosomes protein 6-like [Trifolium medium]
MQELCFLIQIVSRFSRGPVETTLPPRRKQVYGRLSSSVEDDIEKLHNDASNEQKAANDSKRDKRGAEVKLEDLDKKMRSIKRLRFDAGKSFSSKKLFLEDAMLQQAAESSPAPLSSVDEIGEEISTKVHYDNVMKDKVLHDIKEAEEHYLELTKRRE